MERGHMKLETPASFIEILKLRNYKMYVMYKLLREEKWQ